MYFFAGGMEKKGRTDTILIIGLGSGGAVLEEIALAA